MCILDIYQVVTLQHYAILLIKMMIHAQGFLIDSSLDGLIHLS